MARQYTTIAKVQDYLLIVDADYATSKIETWIEDMSEYIENETGRVFEADATASEKKYEAKTNKMLTIGLYQESPVMLLVDEFIAGTNKLTIDTDIIDSDDYIFYPINDSPKTRVVLTEDSGLIFTQDEQNIKFEACWGYSVTPPKSIEFACIVLVAGIILNSLSQEGELQSITIGRYSATYKTQKQMKDFENVEKILQKFTKITL